MTKSYVIEGLDCAVCAGEVENALRQVEGLQGAQVNFATGKVSLDADYLESAQEVIARVEPGARLLVQAGNDSDQSAITSVFWYEWGRILAAAVLFSAGVVFNGFLDATPGSWASWAVFLSAFLLVGAPVLWGAIRNIFRGRVFDELFLMSIASVGAFVLGELAEAAGVMLFYAVGEAFQERAVRRSRQSISAAMALRPDTVRVVTQEGLRNKNPEAVDIGSTIEVRPGELVPLDGEIIEGRSWMDTSALTGEPVARAAAVGDSISAGFVNGDGLLRIRTTRLFSETSVARILDLVENSASKKAPTEKFLSRFAAVYTPVVVALAAAVAVLPPLFFGQSWSQWTYRALVMLVISCPCALVVSVPLSYFAGVGRASRAKVLVKGAVVLDALRKVDTVVFDKTGTLTEGRFLLREHHPVSGVSPELLLETAALTESLSSHPIARSLREAWPGVLSEDALDEFREEKGFGVIARAGERRLLAGSFRLMERYGFKVESSDFDGTVVHVAESQRYLGCLVLDDRLKEGAESALEDLRALGIRRTVLLTGDREESAQRVASYLGISEVRSGLLPEDKVEELEKILSQSSGGTAFVGDGMNDAPVIMRADVGFAMGGMGSDAALEAADAVIMDDDPRRLPQVLGISRFTRRIVLQNIVFALAVKVVLLLLGAGGGIPMWLAVIGDVGVALVAVLNATRILGFGGVDDR